MIFLNRSTKTRFIYVPRNPANKEMSCILVDVFDVLRRMWLKPLTQAYA